MSGSDYPEPWIYRQLADAYKYFSAITPFASLNIRINHARFCKCLFSPNKLEILFLQCWNTIYFNCSFNYIDWNHEANIYLVFNQTHVLSFIFLQSLKSRRAGFSSVDKGKHRKYLNQSCAEQMNGIYKTDSCGRNTGIICFMN